MIQYWHIKSVANTIATPPRGYPCKQPRFCREDILQIIKDTRPLKEVADDWGISEKTVSKYRNKYIIKKKVAK